MSTTAKTSRPDGAVVTRWALLLVVVLAGCASAPQVPVGIPVDASGHALPTLEGTVVDGAIRPLPGVKVWFLGSDVNTTTDGEGHYAIHRPTLKAEAVLVAAFKPGFLARTQQAQVSGHSSTTMDFRLDEDGNTVPHVDVFNHRGTAGCIVVADAAGQRVADRCDDDEAEYNIEGNSTDAPPSIWTVNPTPSLAGAVFEVHWEPTSPASTTLHARLREPLAGGHAAPVVAEATGTGALRLELPADAARAMPDWTAIRLYVELAPPDGLPLGAGYEQPFDAYATLFYVDPAPAGYTLG